MNNQMNIFEYLETFNKQDPEKLEEKEQALFHAWLDQDQLKKPNYTFQVDEDNLARFIELQLMVTKGKEWFATNSLRIKEIQDRLDSAKKGDYLSRDKFMALAKEINILKARAKDFSPRYQQAKVDKQTLLDKEGNSLWACWYNINNPDDFLSEYVNTSISTYFTYNGEYESNDSNHIDSRHSTTDEIFADTHIQEMSEYDVIAKENPFLGDFWAWKEEKKFRKCTFKRSL